MATATMLVPAGVEYPEQVTRPISLADFMGEPTAPPAAPAKPGKNDPPYYGCRQKAQAGQINQVIHEASVRGEKLTSTEIARRVSLNPEFRCGAGRVESHCAFWMAERRQIGKLLRLVDGHYYLQF